jgi:hypothetical protein
MLKAGRWAAAWFVVLALVLGFGVWQLLSLRYEQGDVYPAYSTLRSDPLGARAICESFDLLPGVRCSRNFGALEKLGSGEGSSLLFLGVDWDDYDETEEEEALGLERFMNEGGRLVVVFRGRGSDPILRRATRTTTVMRRQGLGRKGQSRTNLVTDAVLEKRWGVTLDYRALKKDGEGGYEPVDVQRGDASDTLPEELVWRSSLVFRVATNSVSTNLWRNVYLRENMPVVIERRFGRGSAVLMSDAYLTSNEALWKDREPGLLRWLFGASSRLVFDETHLGVTEQPGVATLLRRYHLFWIVGASLAVFGLAIWRNASPLVPATDDDPVAMATAGKDSRSGLVNLLRRSIPPAELLGYCFREWKKSGAARRAVSRDRAQRAEQIAMQMEPEAGKKLNPVDSYREIARTLKTKTPSSSSSSSSSSSRG